MSIPKQRIITPFNNEAVLWNSGILPYQDKFLLMGNSENHDVKKYAVVDAVDFNPVGKIGSFPSKKNFDFRTIQLRDKTYAVFFTKAASYRSAVVLQSFVIQPDLSIKWNTDRTVLEPIEDWPGGYVKTSAEKNWMPFVYRDELYFVYALRPHVILRYNEHTKRVQRVYDMPTDWSKSPLPGGGLSGNSNCVRVGDLYMNTFHSKPFRNYWTGYYFFEARPPFRPVLLGTVPLLEPSDCKEERKSARVQRCFDNVQFPIGLHAAGTDILVSYGVNDITNQIAQIKLDDLMKNTVAL